jgi:hypothetical protein
MIRIALTVLMSLLTFSDALADVALISTTPCVLIGGATVVPNPLVLPPPYGVVVGAGVGWQSADAKLKIVNVPAFVVPGGQVINGAPNYVADGSCNVTVTYPLTSSPLNVIPFPIFISRFTTTEYAGIMAAKAAAIAGNTAGMAMVMQWDEAASGAVVDLNSPAAQNFKNALVSAGLLTAPRAAVIFQ